MIIQKCEKRAVSAIQEARLLRFLDVSSSCAFYVASEALRLPSTAKRPRAHLIFSLVCTAFAAKERKADSLYARASQNPHDVVLSCRIFVMNFKLALILLLALTFVVDGADTCLVGPSIKAFGHYKESSHAIGCA